MAKSKSLKPKWYDQAIIWLIYSLGILVPLIFSTFFYSNFAEAKLLVLRLVTIAIVFLWSWKSYREQKFIYRRGLINCFVLAVAAMQIVSTLTSTHIFSSLFGAETRFLGLFTQLNFLLILIFAYNFLHEKTQLKKFMYTICFTGLVLLSTYGIFQYFGYFQDSFSWSQNPQDRVFGTMGHSNHFGAYLGMCLLLSFGILPLIKNKILRAVIMFFELLTLCTILLTGSRGALAAVVLSALVIIALVAFGARTSLKKWFHKSWKKITIIIVITGVAAAIFYPTISTLPAIERLDSFIKNSSTGTVPDRFSWWLSSLEMIKQRPFLGFGLSTYRDVYNLYRRQDYRVPGDINQQISPESSHNEYLDIAVNQGLIGLAVFLAMLGYIFLKIDKVVLKKEKDSEKLAMVLGLKGAIMVYLFEVFVSFGVVDTLVIFSLLLGSVISLCSANNRGEIHLSRIKKNVGILFVFLIISFGIFGTVREANADYYYRNAKIAEAIEKPDFARSWYEMTIKEQPFQYEYFQAYADFAFNTAISTDVDPTFTKQYLQLALQNYQNAIILNGSHPSTFYNFGIASIQLGIKTSSEAYIGQGINDLKQAIALSPNNTLYAYQSAKVFAEIGQKELARKAYQTVLQIDPEYKDAQAELDKLNAAPATQIPAAP